MHRRGSDNRFDLSSEQIVRFLDSWSKWNIVATPLDDSGNWTLSPIPCLRLLGADGDAVTGDIVEANLLVVSAISAAGTIPGRTSLQKVCYFANFRLGGRVFFFAHYFGPYSPEVARAATELVSSRLVQDRVESGSLSEPWVTTKGRLITEWERHNLTISPDGRRYLKSIQDERKPQIFHVRGIVKNLSKATDLDPSALALAAKVHFIAHSEGAQTWRQVKSKARAHGWDVADGDLKAALRTLARSGFKVTLK